MRTIRPTEDIAVETLYGTGESDPGLLNQLLSLTSGKPTSADLQEAINLLAPIAQALRDWSRSMAKSEVVRLQVGA